MSGRGNKGNDEFKRFREVAPESVDDSTLRQIIAENKGNHENIAAALDRLWSDVGNVPDWTVNSKSKKNQDNSAQSKPQSKSDKSKGGAGKSKDRGARPAQSTPPPASTPTAPKPTAPTSAPKYVNPSPKPATESWPKSASVAAPSAPVWGSGSLADKIKKKEEAERQAAMAAEAAAAAAAVAAMNSEEQSRSGNAETPEPTVQADGAPSKSSGRSRKPRGRGPKTPEVENPSPAAPESEPVVAEPEPVVESPPPVQVHVPEPEQVSVPEVQSEVTPAEPEQIPASVVQEPSTAQNESSSSIPAPFLKLGRWESSSENVSGDLQFGSFGSSFKDESVAPSQSNWGADTSVDSRGIDANWASSQGTSNIGGALNAYFPQATAPPPGLDSQVNKVSPQVGRGNANNQTRTKTEPVQALPQHSQYYQGQPPGILNPPARGVPAATQYPGYGGFDLSQTPFMHPGFPPVAGQSPNAIGTNAASIVPTSSSAASTVPQQPQAQQQQAQQPQAQQQFNPPPGMGYYFPYFPGQYYYGQQAAANYYPQGRGVYPNRGPYPAEGYPGAPMGYPDMYQQGQFGDASSAYGNVPIHPAMPLSSQTAGAPASAIGATGGKAAKTATGAVGSGQQMSATAGQDAAAAAQHAAYGYPYRTDQWQYQGAGQPWGGMMPFPAAGTGLQPNSANSAFNPSGTVGAVGGQPQQQPGAANANSQRTAASAGNAYGASGTFSGGRNPGGTTSSGW